MCLESVPLAVDATRTSMSLEKLAVAACHKFLLQLVLAALHQLPVRHELRTSWPSVLDALHQTLVLAWDTPEACVVDAVPLEAFRRLQKD